MEIRKLERDEIEKVWEIDRSEVIEKFCFYKDGEIHYDVEHYEQKGWYPDEMKETIVHLYDVFDRKGYFLGAFDEGKMVGIVVLESKFIGPKKNKLQLVFLHISNKYRKKGLGTKFMNMAIEKAKELGAEKLYISACPSENTVHFYQSFGAVLSSELNEELFELEPEDIHLELEI